MEAVPPNSVVDCLRKECQGTDKWVTSILHFSQPKYIDEFLQSFMRFNCVTLVDGLNFSFTDVQRCCLGNHIIVSSPFRMSFMVEIVSHLEARGTYGNIVVASVYHITNTDITLPS